MGVTRRLATSLALERMDLKDLNEAFKDPKISVSATPFGATSRKDAVYVKDAVPWKGLVTKDLTKFTEAIREMGYPGVAEGLSKAVRISKECAGRRGVARHPRFGYYVPAKAVCQLELKVSRIGYPKVRVTQL